MSVRKEKINNLERLEIMEDKCGISLEGLSAHLQFYDEEIDAPSIVINGEVHAKNGAEIKTNIQIVATAFDSNGIVLCSDYSNILAERFYVLEYFKITIMNLIDIPVKIRVYPKIW